MDFEGRGFMNYQAIFSSYHKTFRKYITHSDQTISGGHFPLVGSAVPDKESTHTLIKDFIQTKTAEKSKTNCEGLT